MPRSIAITAVLLLALAMSASGLETRAVQMREDYSTEPLYDCYLQYYYYVPCTTSAWFWMDWGWNYGDKVGAWFRVGDVSTGTVAQCDPVNCQTLEQFRVLDFAGYGCKPHYAGLFGVEFDVYCADESGCPVGPPIWSSGYTELCVAGWNYVRPIPPVSLCPCGTEPGPPASSPRILITATHVGHLSYYPAWGLDNISTPVGLGCAMHDNGCLPAIYPRPYNSHYSTMHSGYFGNGGFQYCPARWFKDGLDSTPDGTRYGYIELTWRVYLACSGPSATEPSSWGAIKSMYK